MGKIMIEGESIKNYYSNFNMDQLNPDLIKFRHFRVRNHKGYFVKFSMKTTELNKIKQFLILHKPTDVYYSVAKFLNPHKVGQKGEDNPHFLHCDLVFDIDNEDLNQALIDTRAVLRYGDLNDWNLNYIAFSGGKGFHISYEEPILDDIQGLPTPVERENKSLEFRKLLVEKMKEEEIIFDFKVTTDTRRIIRLPHSLHGKTGNICTPIEKERVYNHSIDDILADIHKIARNSIWNRIKHKLFGDDNSFTTLQTIQRGWNRFEFRSTPRNISTYYYSTFLTNRVPKTNMQIPILEFEYYNQNIKNHLIKLMNIYKLPQFLIMNIGSRYFAVCFKPVQKERMKKILAKSVSQNITHFTKFGYIICEIGPRLYERDNLEELKILQELKNESYMSITNPLSFGHNKFFRNTDLYSIQLPNNVTWIGGKNVEIRYSLIQEN